MTSSYKTSTTSTATTTMDTVRSLIDSNVTYEMAVEKKLKDAIIVKLVYETYREAMGYPEFMPEFDEQTNDVKLAWLLSVTASSIDTGSISGIELYTAYYDAVEGVALKNNRVKLVAFKDMDAKRQHAWNAAASVI